MKRNKRYYRYTIKSKIRKAMENGHTKSSWKEIAISLTAIVTMMTYISISPTLAEYQGNGAVRFWAEIAVIGLSVSLVWEIMCRIGYDTWGRLLTGLSGGCTRIWRYFKNFSLKVKIFSLLSVFLLIAIPIVFLNVYHKTEYYSSVSEVYGLPVGNGEPLSRNEREFRSEYWKIVDYPFKKRVILTYEAPYGQLELMREYSTLYQMSFFQPSARIVYDYRKNEEKYKAYDLVSYESARKNKFREPLEVVYYSSNGKLLLDLKKNEYDKFDVAAYSVEDMPQLLNSTLFLLPDGETAEKTPAAQIKVTYNSDGLPQTRQLSPAVYNMYGVNGERYVYDSEKRLSSLCYLDIHGNPVCNKSGIMMVTFEYTEGDRPNSIRYYGDENGSEKTEGFHGVFCEKFSYDNDGNLSERRQSDRSENPGYDINGIYRYQYTYSNGALLEESFFASYEKPIKDKLFQSHSIKYEAEGEGSRKTISITLDSAGVSEEMKKEAANRTEIFPEQIGWQEMDNINTETGNETGLAVDAVKMGISMTEREWENALDESMQKEKNNQKRNYTVIKYELNGNRSISKISYYDEGGNPVSNEHGYAIKHFGYDEYMRISDEQYCDGSNQPCIIHDGYSAVRNTYEVGRDGKIRSREYLDISGDLTLNRELGYAYVLYERSSQDSKECVTESYYDSAGNPIRLPEYGYAKMERYYDESGCLIRESYYDESGIPACRKDCWIAEIFRDYADNGNMIREWYKDTDGELMNRADTGYAVLYRDFNAGLLTEERYEGYQNQALQPVPDKSTGIACIKISYKNGRKQEEQYFDTEGTLALRSDIGCAIQRYEYNDSGMVSAKSFFDTEGEPVLRKDTGYAEIRFQYGEYNRCSSENYYDTEEKPVISREKYCAGVAYEYDESGNIEREKYFGPDEELMVRSDLGCAQKYMEYDSFGNTVKCVLEDENGNPVRWKGRGYASYESEYENGNWVESRYLDEEGQLTVRRDEGYAVIQLEYNELGQCIAQFYYGTDKKPVISSKYHCAGFRYEYDDMGNRTLIQYLGMDRELMTRRDLGFAQIASEYNSRGDEVKVSYLDAENNPAVWKEGGYASYDNIYDSYGNWIASHYYDLSGKSVLRKDNGYAGVVSQYDQYGQLISRKYYNTNDNPIISSKYQCAGFLYEYDERGNQIVSKAIGTDGEIMVRKDLGYAQTNTEYDDVGREIHIAYLDTEGQPAVWLEGGCASYDNQYDSQGNWIESNYYDAENNPVIHKKEGYASILRQYDAYGQCISQTFYDAGGTDRKPMISSKYLCAGFQYEYDERGNRITAQYIGVDGEMMMREDLGYAQWTSEYDSRGNEIKVAYLNSDGNPTECKGSGYASYENVYDEQNRKVASYYYDTQGNLFSREDTGYAIMSSKYDRMGNWIRSEYYGKDGEAVLNKTEGYSIIYLEYDEYGRRIAWNCYGVDGEPIVSSVYLCAGKRFEYDADGNQTMVQYIGTDGNLMKRQDLGYAMVKYEYDSFGNVVNTTYFDESELPIDE